MIALILWTFIGIALIILGGWAVRRFVPGMTAGAAQAVNIVVVVLIVALVLYFWLPFFGAAMPPMPR